MFEILFQYGPLQIRTYNVCFALGFLLSALFLLRLASRRKMNLAFLSLWALPIVLGTGLGGRLFYVLANLALFKEAPWQALFVWDMEFSGFGALAGLMASLLWATRRSHEAFLPWWDAFLLAALSGILLIHVGDFLGGRNYGSPTEMPWGIAFDAQSIPFVGVRLHPVQLYAAFVTFFIFRLCSKIQRRTHHPGWVGFLGLMLYSLSGFGLEFFRGAPSGSDKIGYLAVAALAFIGFIHASHQPLKLNKNET